ncbi:hypothetical protein GW17_00024107 [Ensete ventricosum]|nr:hypothetical protein GW17_00024107 [Ensete ventricosum]
MEAGPAVAVPALTPVATSASLAATAYAVSSNTAVATTTSVATASAIATASAATKASSSAAASAILRFVDGDVPPVKVLAIHPLDGVPHRLLVPEGLLERAVVGGPGKTADETAELNIRSRHGKDRSRIVDRGGPGRESTRNPKSSPKSAFIDRAAGGCGNLLCRVFGFPCPCVWAVVSPSVGLPPRRALLLPRNKHIRLGGSQKYYLNGGDRGTQKGYTQQFLWPLIECPPTIVPEMLQGANQYIATETLVAGKWDDQKHPRAEQSRGQPSGPPRRRIAGLNYHYRGHHQLPLIIPEQRFSSKSKEKDSSCPLIRSRCAPRDEIKEDTVTSTGCTDMTLRSVTTLRTRSRTSFDKGTSVAMSVIDNWFPKVDTPEPFAPPEGAHRETNQCYCRRTCFWRR